ncbi:MAG: ComF family protein, partial [Planctomycetes bacterium]|nr:ComF family protein [Planctomycetota bacterium]
WLGLRCASRVVARTRATLPQGDVRVTSRDANVAGAFRLRRAGAVRGRPVLLVDDVFTSGSTMRECARVLRAGGAGAVVGLTACDARG